ncbi:YbaB/EbfC family nucleoid-associated protein [Actinopolymorpha alba]|uniref:YbaB/EbfC family nucleoid-associated protein n=1 Tax=Actinopolymorpha alba TaxID=533267 RepID=UPI00037D6FE0|nr:YbaB/EbfC family nucleoid-associated protein [Actinopolymorpha alba]
MKYGEYTALRESVKLRLRAARESVDVLETLDRILDSYGEELKKTVGVGESLEGQVHAEVAADGELRELALDPSLMAMPADELSRAVLEAIQTATDEAREKVRPLSEESPDQ